MKKIKLSALAIFLLLLAGCYVSQPVATQPAPPPPPPPPPPVQEAPPPVGYESFYDGLAPYGTWVEYPRYGYVWIPNAGPNFRPYCTEGYWAYSDLGWTWVSYYSWGWAPFHYGRWFEEPGYGWMWVPGNDWAPAWVAWGNYNGYYGWAPLQPAYAVGGGIYPPMQNWYFTDARYMGDREWSNHYYAAQNNRIVLGNNAYIEDIHNVTIINNTNNYNNRAYNAGPRREEIENTTRRPVQSVQIRDNHQPGRSEISNGALNIYRPRLNNTDNSNIRPNKTVPLQDIKRGDGTPERQPERTPEMNKPERQENRPAPVPQRDNTAPGRRQEEMPRPGITPQQPKQENNQSPPRTRETQAAPPAQQPQQQPRQENNQSPPRSRETQAAPPAQRPQQQPNYHTPARTNISPGAPAQQHQQGKGVTKEKSKSAKQPVKGRQDLQKTVPSEKPPQEKKE